MGLIGMGRHVSHDQIKPRGQRTGTKLCEGPLCLMQWGEGDRVFFDYWESALGFAEAGGCQSLYGSVRPSS